MVLTSKNNPLIKETAALKDKNGRKETGLFLVEGKKMALECLKSDLEIERVFIAENYDGERLFPEEKTVTVSDDVMRYISDEKTPQGIVCRVKIPSFEPIPPKGKCLFLDGVADPGNVGAIVRTANAAGYKSVYLTDECADPYSPKSVRASMSGVFYTKIYRAPRTKLLSLFEGVPLFVADMVGQNVFRFQAPDEFVLAIGNEANGVSEETFSKATDKLSIPMAATQESLNAAVSAAILMYRLSDFNQ